MKKKIIVIFNYVSKKITFILLLNCSSPTILLSIRTIAADLDVVNCSSINVISILEPTSNLIGLDETNPSSHIMGIMWSLIN